MNDQEEPWAWIPHTEGADRQKEINAYLRKVMDEMPLAKPYAAEDSQGGK